MAVKKIIFTDESVKRHITDLIRENSTDSDLESITFETMVFHCFRFRE